LAEEQIELAAFELPYRRKAAIRRVTFDSGMTMARLVLREGTRITQVDLDAEAALKLGEALVAAAREL
jgi:hypothetical protein